MSFQDYHLRSNNVNVCLYRIDTDVDTLCAFHVTTSAELRKIVGHRQPFQDLIRLERNLSALNLFVSEWSIAGDSGRYYCRATTSCTLGLRVGSSAEAR